MPLAVGIAISPIPIIAAILMLLSPSAKATSVGFLVGWLAGIVGAIVLVTVLSSVLPQEDSSGSSPVAGVIKIIVGALLLFLAAKQWRGRPAEGEQAAMPKWMSAIDSMTAAKGLGLGFLLSAVNAKNLMAISAGLIIGDANLSVGDTTVVIVVFVLLAGCTVLVPVIGYLVASAQMAGPLDSLRGWLVDNNATIMAVVLLVIGVSVIGKGIASF